jgi:hypothetical protein
MLLAAQGLHGRDHHLWIMYGALAKRNFKVCMGVKPAAVTCAVTTSLTFVAQDTKAHLSLSFLKSLLVHIFLQLQQMLQIITRNTEQSI